MKKKTVLLLASITLTVMLATVTAWAAAGDLDGSFGDGGKVVNDTSPGASDVEVLPSGKILTVGNSGRSAVVLVRYNRDGSLDQTFGGGDGEVRTDFPGYASAHALLVQPDGKIVLAGGYSNDRNTGYFALMRFGKDGTPDGTFGGGDGLATADFGAGNYAEGYALVLQPDGKLVVAGRTGRPASDTELFFEDVALARFDGDGSLDKGFGGGDGKVATDVGPGDDIAQDLVLKPNGRLVVAGYSARTAERFPRTRFLLLRYGPSGRLDESFGEGGKVTTGFGYDSMATSLVRQPDNKLIVAGHTRRSEDSDSVFALAGYKPDGTLDPSFGQGGRVTTRVGDEYAYARDLVRQPSGALVAAGVGDLRSEAVGADFWAFALARYAPSGVIDGSFGTNGRVLTSFRNAGDSLQAVAAQSDGRLIAVGTASRCNHGSDPDDDSASACKYSAALARYTAK